MESGTMKSLKMDLDNPALNIDEQNKQLAHLKNYFIKYRGRHYLYGWQYFYVVIFNALHVMLDIIITHFRGLCVHKECIYLVRAQKGLGCFHKNIACV